ncbi:MAG: cbb3-type cytochrome c oxidase subunit I [Gammaproteobacteria bacterium]|nr:cbb3-type cytochrome c oxidase subunit I [Gammaproteobacteria bacterium]
MTTAAAQSIPIGQFSVERLSVGQRLAVKYFTVAIILFLAQIVFGLLAGLQYLNPDFLYEVLDFNVNRMVHINAMVVWMLYGFIGSVYWLVEDEAGTDLVGAKLGNLAFWVLTLAVTVVVLVYLFIQVGPGEKASIWLINEGREYIEAPRWADIGIVAVVLVFFYNVSATFMKGKWSGISGVLVLDLVALAALYLCGMFFTTNISMDQYWWWWVIHLWVEATWEVLVGCIMAWGLMKTLGARRKIVTTWLYIEVALMFGSGILGLGHHYFWIGTPEYWLTIGGFFSALEPIPLVAMVVHAVYDSGVHRFKNANHPALAWLIAHAFGNFFGAGVWGFMHTLPQINLYTHGTQWTSSHGHLAFFGAYATIIIAMIYIAIQKGRGDVFMGRDIPGAWRWKWALGLSCVGVIGMTVALLISGYEQSFIERALNGSTWEGYFEAQRAKWFVQGMYWRQVWGWVTAIGVGLLAWDLLVIGKRETREAVYTSDDLQPATE